MARISEEDEEEETVKQVQLPSLSLNEIKHGIENILKKIEVLDPFDKQAAIILLQECIEHLQTQIDPDDIPIPQLDGNFDLVIFCDCCNKEFMGDRRGRDRQTHYINVHLRSRFEEITPMKSENYFECNESGCQFKATRKLDFWRHKGGKHGFIDKYLKEHFAQNPPLIPANGAVTLEARRDHEHQMVTEKSQGDDEDKVSMGEEHSPRLPQGGDGISPSSDESETTGGSGGGYNRNTDIKVSGDYASITLQVRRGSEPALNKMEASGGEGGRPGGSGHSSYTGENEQNKRWSTAVLNRDVRSSKTDLSVIDEASSYSDQHLGPHRGLSPLPPPFERGQGSGAARDSDRTNPFTQEANRLSIQSGHEDGWGLEAAEKASDPSYSHQNSHGLDDIGLGYQQDSGRGSQKVRREPLGGRSLPQPQPKQNNIDQIDSSISVSAMETQRREEAIAVASILVETSFIEDTESQRISIPGQSNNIKETEKNNDIKFNLPNNASYLIFKNCGQKLGDVISLLLKRRSQKLSSFEAFASGNKPLDLSEDCSTLRSREVWVQPRVLFRLELLNNVSLDIKAMDGAVIEDVLSNIVVKHGLKLPDLEVSVSRYGGHLESVDLRENVTSIDNTLVVIRNMTGDQTQEIVDECPERPPRTSTPVPGHNEEIGGLFLNTTDLMLREHSYSSVSRAGSVSFLSLRT